MQDTIGRVGGEAALQRLLDQTPGALLRERGREDRLDVQRLDGRSRDPLENPVVGKRACDRVDGGAVQQLVAHGL